MNYARIIDEFTIDTVVPREAYDSQGRLVVGDLTTKPELLKTLDFYPLEEAHDVIPDGYHAVMHYTFDSQNEKIVQTAEMVKDPDPPPASYSKLKILMAAQTADPPFINTLISFLESSPTIKYIWDASNTIEDNELLGQYLPDVAQALGKTVDEVKAFLDSNCVAD